LASRACLLRAASAALHATSIFGKNVKMLLKSLFDVLPKISKIVKMLVNSLFDDFAENRQKRQNAPKVAF